MSQIPANPRSRPARALLSPAAARRRRCSACSPAAPPSTSSSGSGSSSPATAAAARHGRRSRDMDDVWIEFTLAGSAARPIRLHGLWPPQRRATDGPVLLYLHGARWNVEGSAPRIRRMQELGFSVLAIDYRGFGKSTAGPALGRTGLRGRTRRLGLARRANTRSALATSSATRWAAPSRSTWPPRSTTSAAPSSKARSPRSPTWPAP